MAPADRKAIARELRAMMPQLRAAAQSLCGDAPRAEDLVQDTLLRAWRSLDSFAAGTNLRAWMFTILRNGFYSERRRAWRQQPLDPAEAERLLGPDDPLACLHLLDVRRAMFELPKDQREAVLLIGGAGLSHEEAAERAGCAVGTMKSRVSRAREALRQILEQRTLQPGDVPARAVFAAFLDDIERLTRSGGPEGVSSRGGAAFPGTGAAAGFSDKGAALGA